MSRRQIRWLMALIAVVAILLGLYLSRLPLAEWALSSYLESRGLPGRARVTALGPRGLQLSDLELEELRAEALDIGWRWSLAQGVVLTDVTVTAPRLDLALGAAEPPFPVLRRMLSRPDTGSRPMQPLSLPALAVREGRASLATGRGPVRLEYSMTTDVGEAGASIYAGMISAHGAGLTASVDYRVRWRGDAPEEISLSVVLDDLERGEEAQAALNARVVGQELTARFDLEGVVTASLARRLGLLPDGTEGRVEASLHSLSTWAVEPAAETWIRPLRARADVSIEVHDLSLPEVFESAGLRLSGTAGFDHRQGLIEFLPSKALTLQVQDLQHGALPPGLAEIISPRAFRQLSATTETDRVTFHPETGRLSVDRAGITLTGDAGDTITVEGSAELRLDPALAWIVHADTRFSSPGSVRDLSGLRGAGSFQLSVSADSYELELSGPTTLSFKPAANLMPAPVSFLAGEKLEIAAGALDSSRPVWIRARSAADGWDLAFDGRFSMQSPSIQHLEVLSLGEAWSEVAGPMGVQARTIEFRAGGLQTPHGILEKASGRGNLNMVDDRLEAGLSLDASLPILALPDGEARGLDISAGLAVAGHPRDLHLTFGPSTLGMESLALAAPTALVVSPVSLRIDALDGTLRDGTPSVNSARLGFDSMELEIEGRRLAPAAGSLEISAPGSGVVEVELELASITAPAEEITVDELRVAARRSADGRDSATLERAVVRDLGRPRRFPPSSLTGALLRTGPQFNAELTARPVLASQVSFSVSGEYRSDTDRGTARFRADGLDFGKQLQPRMLWPGLSPLEKVTGYLKAEGGAVFTSAGIEESGAEIELRLPRFDSDGTRVAGLVMPLSLSSLWPVESPPGQRLFIDSVGDGVGASGLQVDYRLAPGEGPAPVLEIEEAVVDVLGGRLRVGKTRFDPARDSQAMVLEAQRLDLVSVLSLISQEGVGGEGRLTGRLPIRLEGEEIVIEDGLLEAETPGRLAFDSPAASQTLSQGGDHVTLLLQALQDFHYDRLSLSADKPAGGATRLRLSLAGYNPDVLDGYPFAINIDLETDAAPLLSVLKQGNDMVDEIVKRVWRP